MLFLRVLSILIIIVAACPVRTEAAPGNAFKNDAEAVQALDEGIKIMKSGKPQEAIDGYFDKIIAYFENKYASEKRQIYCAHTPAETVFYLTGAAVEHKNAVMAPSAWADACFMKSYSLTELGRNAEARSFLERSIALSPRNAQYLSELGQMFQNEKKWDKALEIYQKAEDGAQNTASPASKTYLLGRAMRGIGYSLTELGRFDEAEAKYRKCLELDPNDRKAAGEIEYIRKLRAKTEIR